ncbi:MAG: flagellar biosynthesis protein FlhB [Planctomycetota bacterium]|nr:flagellar biosynthesis protein FlhB [Planctomycetota bacterium]
MAEQTDKEDKTEEATPKRLSDAREKGQVAFSTETMSAFGLVAALIGFALAGPALAEATGAGVVDGLNRMGDLGMAELDHHAFAGLMASTIKNILPAIGGLLLPVLLMAVIVGYSQVGGVRLSPQAIAPKWNKLDPIAGLKRMFGAKAWMRTGMAALKLLALATTVVLVIWKDVLQVGALAGADLGPCLAAVLRLASKAAIAGVLAVLAISLFDLWFQRTQFSKEMRMSKKEIKDEHKSSEGDPHVKAKIRQIQREVAGRRMMQDVPDATVVVTNPTHFAVALKYDEDAPGAPKVVAKGIDEVARRIKEIAREEGVLVYEDPPLARALHRDCEIGDEVPEDLFQAVAGVLAYVYRVQGGAPVTA